MVTSFLFKVYLESKIKNPKSNESIFSIIAFRGYGIGSLFPLTTKVRDENEKRVRIKANIALVVFYASFTTIIILSKLH